MKNLFILLFSLLLLSPPALAEEVRIVGGLEASHSGREAVGSLYDNRLPPANEGHFCAATLIRPRWALTAGHCLEYMTKGRTDIVFARDDLRFPGGVTRAVVRSFLFPKYDTDKSSWDIALLRLSGKPRGVRPLPLRFRIPAAGKNLTVLGWGQTSPVSDPSPLLRQATVRIKRTSRCYSYINQREAFCAGGRRDVCFGDSGGPALNRQGQIVAVISRGARCGHPDYPGVYSRLLFARKWINRILQQKIPGPFRQPSREKPYDPLIVPFEASLGEAGFDGWRAFNAAIYSQEKVRSAEMSFHKNGSQDPSFCSLEGECGAGPWNLQKINHPNQEVFALDARSKDKCLRFSWKISFQDSRLPPKRGVKRVCQ